MFDYCPKCKSGEIQFNGETKFFCQNCHFEFYKNIAAGVVGVFTYKSKILFQVRGQEPAKGKLDMPGGFINPNETAEKALTRESFEEIGIHIDRFKFLGTAPNQYLYKGINYHVCDIIFHAEIEKESFKIDPNEVSAIKFYKPDEIPVDEIAFPSIQEAVNLYIRNYK